MSQSMPASLLRTADHIGILAREVPVRVLNCSSSGCLLETNSRVEVGATGSLTLTVDGEHLVGHVLVVRCKAIEGAGSRYHVGAKFLWTDASDDHALRRAMPHRAPGEAKFIS